MERRLQAARPRTHCLAACPPLRAATLPEECCDPPSGAACLMYVHYHGCAGLSSPMLGMFSVERGM